MTEMNKRIPDYENPLTVADFQLGETVFVNADQGIRRGEITKLGRTRLTVMHPRNQQGSIVERTYGMDRIVVGQKQALGGWSLVYANGHTYRLGLSRKNPWPDVPVIYGVVKNGT